MWEKVDRRDSAEMDEGGWTDRNVELILHNAASAGSTSQTSLTRLLRRDMTEAEGKGQQKTDVSLLLTPVI
ncbi:hypothetical protein ASE05_19130 [Mesorhizobium sp. Root172]|nr:hypothetical protein ASE05_19130 [Mesorhizobium sp. Root172]